MFLAFIFISYFVEPRDLLRRLASLDIHTAGGISGAAVTLVTFLDFSLVRQRFCTTVCPYGYLQGMLGDGNTLLVHYRDETHDCIECKKCVRVCPMGIDIRKSPFQIECVHCAECIDACDEILARLNKPGLIHYAWGEKGELLPTSRARGTSAWACATPSAWSCCWCCCAMRRACSWRWRMRRAVLVHVSPERATLYRVAPMAASTTGSATPSPTAAASPAAVVFSIQHLPGATLALEPNPVAVQPGESAQGEFEISAPGRRRDELVSHFTIVTSTVPDQESDTIPMTFLAPTERNENKQPVPVLIPVSDPGLLLFIGILIFAYVETKKANPQMIEVGRTPWSRGSPWTALPA